MSTDLSVHKKELLGAKAHGTGDQAQVASALALIEIAEVLNKILDRLPRRSAWDGPR